MGKEAKSIIHRHIEPDLSRLLSQFSSTIDRYVDFGGTLFDYDARTRREELYHGPIILSLRHFLDLADSVSVLVKASSIEPCKLILRGMLDTYFNMTFLLEEGYTEKRGMAFLVWDIHKKIKNAEKTDETSEAGKALRKSLLNDQAASFITVPHNDQAQKKIEEYKKLLESPEFVEAEQEYQKVKKVNENPPWHMMFDGKRNTPELAKYLKLTSYYEELYRELSGPVHGTEIFNRVSNRDDERVDVGVVRSYTAAQHVASWTLHISYRMFDLYTQKRLTEKRDEYKEWVMSVKEAHQKICSSQTLIKEVE